MKKHCTLGKKSLVIAIEMLSVLGIVGIIWFLIARCIVVTDDKKATYVIDPFEEKTYEESYSMADMFDQDSAKMIYYLALCQQFETEGKFDEQKNIDVLEYYYRKQQGDNIRVSSEGELVYNIQDLIHWGNTYGVFLEDGKLVERYYPVDEISISEKNMWHILQHALPGGIQGFSSVDGNHDEVYTEETYTEETTNEIETEVSIEEYGGEDYVSSEEEAVSYVLTFLESDLKSVTLEECENGMKAVDYLNATGYIPEATSNAIKEIVQNEGNYNGTEIEFYLAYLHEMAIYVEQEEENSLVEAVYAYIMETVIYDLCYNYVQYQEYKESFIDNNINFKYIYLPEDETQYYSNLEIESREQAEKMTAYFNDELAAYVVISPVTKKVIQKSSNVTVDSILPMLDKVGYSFKEKGGIIYIGVLKENVEGLSDYTTSDHYAKAQNAYTDFRKEFPTYAVILCLLLLGAVITFILYTCMCGNKAWYENGKEEKEKRLVIAEKPCSMGSFDNWFTEIAFAIALIVAFCLILGFCAGINLLSSSNFEFYYLKKTAIFVVALVYAAICNGLFLFFYGSLVRRIKLGSLWKGSLLVFLFGTCKKLYRKSKVFFLEVYYRRSIVARMVLYYVPILFANFILIMLGTTCFCHSDIDMGILLYLLLAIGDSIILYFVFKNNIKRQEIMEGIEKINGGEFGFQIDTTTLKGDNLRLAEAINHIGISIKQAVETSMKDERLKADLITNVSHDIKTPLTSIINYVDLLKRENIQDIKMKEYVEVLDVKSQRLKQLTEDLVEASKISSGNITLLYEKLRVVELMNQIIGEFSEKFQEKNLDVIVNFMDKDAVILADGRRMWRVFENLFGNIYKYALSGTRVYLEVYKMSEKVHIAIKNISSQPLNIDADELTERFIRGDISRSTEGSGLGLSIAKNLVQAQKGEFKIYLDGDLFKVTITFDQEAETES